MITKLLQEWRDGDEQALDRLTEEIYQELRRLAGSVMRGQSDVTTLQPTVLVHELYLKLPGVQHVDWQNRAQFFNIAARMMRNILVDNARRRQAAKRGGDQLQVTAEARSEDRLLQLDVLAVHEALDRFAVDYPRQAKVVELRFFGGLTAEETSQVLNATGIESSLRTVERDWTFARAWLHNVITT